MIVTIGHSTRTLEEFIEILEAYAALHNRRAPLRGIAPAPAFQSGSARRRDSHNTRWRKRFDGGGGLARRACA